MRRAAVLAGLALLLAGCGGDDEEAATTTASRADWAIAFVRDGSLSLRSSLDTGGPITRGSAFRRVVDRNPAFSPDGESIAFVSDRGERPQDDVYVLPVGGGEPRRVTDDARIELEPVWRDATTLVFVSCAIDFGECELAQVRATGGSRERLRGVEGPLELAQVRDGTLVYARPAGAALDLELDLYSMPLAGGEERRLTSEPGRDHEPDVAHDGRIAFARDAGAPGLARDIYVMDANGSEVRRLTDAPADDLAPAWSPDGERIAWVRSGGGDPELWVMNADGTCAQALTQNTAADVQPVWDPRYRPGPLDC